MYSLLRMKAFILVKFFVCVLFLLGCSVRHIPLDQSAVEPDPVMEYVAGSYYSGNGISSPSFAPDAWRMSQYYRGGISSGQSSSALGYQTSGRLNVDPNPYDSYRSSEVPIMRAPTTQYAPPSEQEIVETRRRTRSPQSSDWRRKRVVDQAGSNGRQVRRSLEQRRHAEDIDEDDESNKEKSRQKNHKRTRRRK